MATLAIRYSQPGTPANSFTTVLWLHSSTGTFDEGWKIRYDGWTQGVTQYSGGGWTNVEERITLKIEASSANDLSAKLIKLDTAIEDVQFHLQSNSNRTYWLFTALSGEAAPDGDESNQAYRISPILSIASSFNDGLFGVHPNTVRQYTIIITRKPMFEGLNVVSLDPLQYAYYNISESLSLRTLGGTDTFSNAVEGTSPARINKLDFKAVSGGGGPLTEMWLGFRSNKLGAAANFVPIWELEDSFNTELGDDTSVASEASDTSPLGSSVDNKLRCTFSGNEDMATRTTMALTNATTSAQRDDQRGRHLVLLRAKVDGTRTAYARMDLGYRFATNWNTGTRILVDSSDWYLYPLGYIIIPSTRYSEMEMIAGGGVVFDYVGIRISAQSAGGSGNLDMDCLILIPQDEGAVYVNNANIEFTEAVAGLASVGHDPLDNLYAANRPSTALTIGKNLEVQSEHLALPVGSGIVGVVAAQRTSSQVLADLIDVDVLGRFRWRSLRGTEGYG